MILKNMRERRIWRKEVKAIMKIYHLSKKDVKDIKEFHEELLRSGIPNPFLDSWTKKECTNDNR